VGYTGRVSEPEWQLITASIATAAAQAGLDLVQPFSVAHYNAASPEAERLDGLGRSTPGALGILLGNTRRLWPAFTAAYAQDAALAREAQPLDTYVVTRLSALLANATSARTQVVFAHVTAPRAFPIQRLAERVGLAAVSPSHLAIHLLHGPWLALRAVLVIDVPGPEAAPAAVARPCLGCHAPCVPALQQALLLSGEPLSSPAVAQHTAAWIAVRDACPVGQSSRYGEAQLAYHYAPNRSRIVPES
jgi:cyanocobalamin reductase (cyanide-eliminating) / alkylcobalamin dealkylase